MSIVKKTAIKKQQSDAVVNGEKKDHSKAPFFLQKAEDAKKALDKINWSALGKK
jgi:hypothetical protein